MDEINNGDQIVDDDPYFDTSRESHDSQVEMPDIQMPVERGSTKYPRIDNIYLKKGSFAFDECNSNIWMQRVPYGKKEKTKELISYLLMGFFVGTAAMFMVIVEEVIQHMVNAMMN